MRAKIKRLVPDPLLRVARELWFAYQHGKQWPLATLHPWRRDSIKQLASYKDILKGERCFIIGNGPSLNKTDVSKLQNEFTFGMNRIYLAFPDWGFEPTYFASVNDLVIEQSSKEIRALKMPKFLSWHSRPHISPTDNTMFLHTTYTGPKFSEDVRHRVWEGGTVTYVALQLAFYMGFEKVILIGVDHNYQNKGEPNKTIVSGGDDIDHFHAGYFGKGFRWQLPDLEAWDLAYNQARTAYENAGREVIDATIGGKLQVFPKVDYDSLF